MFETVLSEMVLVTWTTFEPDMECTETSCPSVVEVVWVFSRKLRTHDLKRSASSMRWKFRSKLLFGLLGLYICYH